jgi:hypothetical protein
MIFTETQKQKLEQYLASHHIPSGLGTENEACSIAAINLAISGRLTDEIPDCMSLVVGKWIIRIQDQMPDAMRNSVEWKTLLPLAAGTGRDQETKRLAIILDWMWRGLEPLQPFADKHNFGDKWAAMLLEKTSSSAKTVVAAAVAVADAAYAAVADAADAADAAAAYAAYAAADAYAAVAVAVAKAVAEADTADAAAADADDDAYAAVAAAVAKAVAKAADAAAADADAAVAADAYAAVAVAVAKAVAKAAAADADDDAYAAYAAAVADDAYAAYAAAVAEADTADAAAAYAVYAAAVAAAKAAAADAAAQYWATVVNPCALLQALCQGETLSETCV